MKVYKTSEVATLFGIHPNMVRLYEEWEMIPKAECRENGYRVYTSEGIKYLKLNIYLQKAIKNAETMIRMISEMKIKFS